MQASFEMREEDGQTRLVCSGVWRTLSLAQAFQGLSRLDPGAKKSWHVDLSHIEGLDTGGAWIIRRFMEGVRARGGKVSLVCNNKLYKKLIEELSVPEAPGESEGKRLTFLGFVENLGKKAIHQVQETLLLISFFGEVCVSLLGVMMRPRTLRLRATCHHLQEVGLNALPIVGLISFLIGVVLVYQGANQLKRFGAEIFTVDLLAVSVLREIGILLTAIVVAGRSGSAFTAQIGYMQLNQEVDAMRVMSLDPVTYLVVPRLIALVVALPLLGFFSDMMALMGGALMGDVLIGLNFSQFLTQLNLSIGAWTFWTGIIKAPVFAFVVALVGCFEGLRVHGGADSVGQQTTRSVVKSIFLVIVMDAIFSIFFSYMGI